MRAYRAKTLTELHDLMCTRLVEGTKEPSKNQLDVISSVDVQIHDVIAEAQSMEWDFDLKSMWLTPSRWTMMINQYLDGADVEAWLRQSVERIGTKKRGIAVCRTKIVRPRGGALSGHSNQTTRRWGSCMLAVSYKALPQPTITLSSRTSYLGYLGALDISVAQVLGRYLGNAVGIPVEEMKFVWMNQAIQWHNFKSLAYLVNNPDEERRLAYRRLMTLGRTKMREDELRTLDASPALTLSRNWLTKLRKEDRDMTTYGDMTYNTYRRIRRRWHTEVFGYEFAKRYEGWSFYKTGEKAGQQKEFFKAYQPLPHCHVSTLTLDKIGILPNGQWSQVPVGSGPDMEDDDEDD